MAVDVTIYEEGSGGELQLLNEDLALSEGLTNQVYLALFGGNLEQSTSPDIEALDVRQDWWGNELLNEENQFNSTFERTLSEVALNSAGIRVLENAVKEDLSYLSAYADISIESSLIGLNRLEIFITLQEPGQDSIKIKLLWDGTREEAIFNILL